MLYFFFLLFFGLVNLLVWILAVRHSKKGQFYSDTPLLLPLSIFIWGDALILAPFWVIVAVIASFFPPVRLVQFYLLTISIRSAYEVIYWLLHQAVQKDYVPPLFRQVTWLKSNDAAILYQLLNMCQLLLGLGGLWILFYYFH